MCCFRSPCTPIRAFRKAGVGGVNGDTGAVQASTGTSVLPNTSAVPPALNVTGLVIAGGAAGGGLLLLAGLGLAGRRRTS